MSQGILLLDFLCMILSLFYHVKDILPFRYCVKKIYELFIGIAFLELFKDVSYGSFTGDLATPCDRSIGIQY